MNKATDITVVIPSFNPDEKLLRLIKDLKKFDFHKLIVVNDGSDQAYKDFFQEAEMLGAKILTHDTNQGKGKALKTAFQYCSNLDDCIGVITVDGDGQHRVKDICACSEAMLNEKDKVILGTRDFTKNGIPFRSRFGNNVLLMMFRVLCGINISDTQTGLRAIPAQFLERFSSYQGNKYEYETNMLIRMKKEKIGWKEVKIDTVYIDNNQSSHFRPLRDSLKIYKVIFKYWGKELLFN